MRRSALALGILIASSSALLGEREVAACGGCFRTPTETASDVTDERMLFSVSLQQTTLYDQIRYVGNPSSFAWVLPIHGTVDVGLSADVLFDSIDALTATQIQAPAPNCPVPSACQNRGGFNSSVPAAGASAGGGQVSVIKQENVGPYATVQLSSTDPGALEAWLKSNGYEIPADVQPVLDEYVREGFDFLAMKLQPNQGVQSMRPVRVSSPGAGNSLPLRMAAIGTGATVGISIWVVADGRYEPQNFPFFRIQDSELVWDWSAGSSNYSTLRAQHEQALGNAGWEMESSLDLAEDLVRNVVLSGGQYYGGGGYVGPTSDASQDYLPVTRSDGTIESADDVREADLTALFLGMAGPTVRVTRIRSDIAHAAMTKDFVLQASQDQSPLTNVRYVTAQVNLSCPIYGSDCSIVGSGSVGEAAASGPAFGGCSASPSRSGDLTIAFAALGGMLSLSALRARRRRRV